MLQSVPRRNRHVSLSFSPSFSLGDVVERHAGADSAREGPELERFWASNVPVSARQIAGRSRGIGVSVLADANTALVGGSH